MLHHEDQPEEAVTGPRPEEAASEVRVTAEEFARAVARYQARRDQAAQRMEGTVAIGDAVHELGLEATPEEILSEVKAERELRKVQPAAPRSRANLLLRVGLPLALFFSTLSWMIRTQPPQASIPASVIATPPPSPLVNASAPPTMLVQDSHGGKPLLRTLSEIPDGVPIRCALDMTASRATFVDFSHGYSDTTWTLIKHAGRVYVRGWIADMSPQAIKTSTVSLYIRRDMVPLGVAPTPVTLRLDGFETNPALDSDDTILAEHVRTDAHFAEAWQSGSDAGN